MTIITNCLPSLAHIIKTSDRIYGLYFTKCRYNLKAKFYVTSTFSQLVQEVRRGSDCCLPTCRAFRKYHTIVTQTSISIDPPIKPYVIRQMTQLLSSCVFSPCRPFRDVGPLNTWPRGEIFVVSPDVRSEISRSENNSTT